jgi:sigma-B regulation protein RsbU (phosphoserine phosphatase)
VETPALPVSEGAAPASPSTVITQLGRGILKAEEIDLRELVGHSNTVEASTKTEDVARTFSQTNVEFLAVLESDKLAGMCSRHELSALLGGRYGFSLWARNPIQKHLRKNEIRITVGDPIVAVLATVFARGQEQFYDDVLLVDPAGDLIGLIATETLFKVQNALLRGNILELETKEREIRAKNEQMETDLRMAMELQQALFPKEYPLFPSTASPRTARLRFAHLYQPASLVGGDFLHVVRVSDQEAGVFIFDVMGHGVRSALITAMLRALIAAEGVNFADPGLLMTHLNRELTAILRQTGTVLFVTALYCVFQCDQMTMRHARAGHHPPLHVRRHSGEVHFASGADEAAGPALGLFPGAPFGTTVTQLSPGDLVLLFTDGIIEAESATGSEWGPAGLKQAVRANLAAPGSVLLDLLLAKAQTFTGIHEFVDDVCLAAVELLEEPPAIA